MLPTHEAMYDFESQGEAEMPLKKKDRLRVIPADDDRDGWVFATRLSAPFDAGYVPQEYLQELPQRSPSPTSLIDPNLSTNNVNNLVVESSTSAESSLAKVLTKVSNLSINKGNNSEINSVQRNITFKQDNVKEENFSQDEVEFDTKTDHEMQRFLFKKKEENANQDTQENKILSANEIQMRNTLVDISAMSVAAASQDYEKMEKSNKIFVDNLVSSKRDRVLQLRYAVDIVSQNAVSCIQQNSSIGNRLDELEILVQSEQEKWKAQLDIELEQLDDVAIEMDNEAVGSHQIRNLLGTKFGMDSISNVLSAGIDDLEKHENREIG